MARTGQLIAVRLARTLLCALFAVALYTGAGAAIPDARAAYTCETQNICEEGTAYQQCMQAASSADAYLAKLGGGSVTDRCTRAEFAGSPYFKCRMFTYQDFACTSSQGGWFFYLKNKTCDKRPDWNGAYPYLTGGKPRNGSVTCNDGCKQAWFSGGDEGYYVGKYTVDPGTCSGFDDKKCKAEFGSNYYWNQGMSSCEPEAPKCPNGAKANSLGKCEPEPCPDGMAQQQDGTCKKKENECPAGKVRSPDGRCLDGDGQCAKGEVRGPDGTCKRDSDGDGKPDEPGEKETFSGGDDCSIPPSCSGSPILCGQARIQWRIDCNTRRNRNIAGGSCAAMPICTGDKCDALEYSQLLMQWRTACATEKLAGKGGDNGSGGAQPEWTKVGGMSTDPGAGASPDDVKVLTTKQISVSALDQSGIGGGGSCMGFAAGGGSGLASGFMQVLSSPPAFFCNYIAQIKAILILLASVTSVFILSRGAP